ncbi:MAG: Xaa-Pro aminopeptidase, partial [Antricoccus sp.]
AAAKTEGIDGAIYSHPVGTHGHAAVPTIGMWDNQGRTNGQGDYPFFPDTIYALELAIWQHIPEWDNQRVMIGLEQGVTLQSDGVHFLDQRQTDWIVV